MSLFKGTNDDSEDEICETELPGKDRDNSCRGLGANSEGQSLQQRNQHQTIREKRRTRESPVHLEDRVLPEEGAGLSYPKP